MNYCTWLKKIHRKNYKLHMNYKLQNSLDIKANYILHIHQYVFELRKSIICILIPLQRNCYRIVVDSMVLIVWKKMMDAWICCQTLIGL